MKRNSDQVLDTHYQHTYEPGVIGAALLPTYAKPRWQNQNHAYDVLSITIQSLQYKIDAFRSIEQPDICFLQIECPKERYQAFNENQRLTLSKTQDILHTHDLFAPIVNAGHFMQLQIPILQAKNMLIQGLRIDLSKLLPDNTTSTLIAFDILFFFLRDYILFEKPEVQVIHIAKQDGDEQTKWQKIQELLAVINAPPAVLFKKVMEYASSNQVELPIWLAEQFFLEPELAKDPEALEVGYQSFVSVLSAERLKALTEKELQILTAKAVDMIYTYTLADTHGVIGQLLFELARRKGCLYRMRQVNPQVRMNVHALSLVLEIFQGFSLKPNGKCLK